MYSFLPSFPARGVSQVQRHGGHARLHHGSRQEGGLPGVRGKPAYGGSEAQQHTRRSRGDTVSYSTVPAVSAAPFAPALFRRSCYFPFVRQTLPSGVVPSCSACLVALKDCVHCLCHFKGYVCWSWRLSGILSRRLTAADTIPAVF